MSLYFVFTVDGDWDEYFNVKLPAKQRQPDKKTLIKLIGRQMALAGTINGRQLHFVHTSPLVRDFFLRPEMIALWKEMESQGGEVGVHCHEEELYSAWYSADQARMEKVITETAEKLRENGLTVRAFRGGFLSFSPKTIPILEENELFLDFSCDPGRHLEYNNQVVADWRGAPGNYYRLSYDDHRQPGNSRVFEIPLGIYLEKQSLWSIWRKARQLQRQPGQTIVSVLAHTYDFTSWKMRLKMKLALLILKRYGKFMNAEEVLRFVSHQEFL